MTTFHILLPFSFVTPEHVIVESENIKAEDREVREQRQSSNFRLACPGLAQCVTLRECPQILAEATSRCYNSDRSLFCGVNQNFEPYVCCPVYQSPNFMHDQPSTGSMNNGNGNNFNYNGFNALDKLSGTCGKSLIQGQGSSYKKLGAYPFVARIGFKSE